MLMKFAPSLRNTVVEFGFASALRVSTNVSTQVLVGRPPTCPRQSTKQLCVMVWPMCVVRQELRQVAGGA